MHCLKHLSKLQGLSLEELNCHKALDLCRNLDIELYRNLDFESEVALLYG